MAAFREWRKVNFFELHENKDGGKVAEALQDTTIEVCTSGYSQLVIADGKGWIHLFPRNWNTTSFKAYEHFTFLALQLKHDPFLVTVGEDETGIKSVLKVWDCSRKDSHDNPVCVRITKVSRVKSTPSAIAVHDSKNLMALGFDDGVLKLFKGEISRHRSSKEVELRYNSNGDATAITGLAFRGGSHLFVASRSAVMVFTINSSGKERGVPIDENDLPKNRGCMPNCAVLIQDQQFVIARNDAIYCYTTDGRGSCYAVEGKKKRVDWFRSYIVTVSEDDETSKDQTSTEESTNCDHITILDIQNKFVVFSMPIDKVKAVLTEWGASYIITEDKRVHHLDEKDLQSKLNLLFKKNLYDVAIRIASSQKYDPERLVDFYTQYGDHLFKKGDPKGAVEQYIKTIGRLETSYVIRKYLEARHLEPLTHYLQELHKQGLATGDHTTLLLTCFVKLDQHDEHGKLKEFLNNKDNSIDFDVEIAIKVCRQVSCDDALLIAKNHKQHDWYLRIVTEDKKDYSAALDYIADLEFDSANFFMQKYGNILMQHLPKQTTIFLTLICTEYKPKSQPLVSDAMMAGVVTRNINRAPPEEYIHLFLNNSEHLVEFIEYLVEYDSNWSARIYNTLIEHHIHVWSSLNKPTLKEISEQKVIKILQNPGANYDKDQTLIVCLMSNFKPGILYLYEEYKLYQQILRYHIAQKDMDSAMNCCRKFGAQEPHLWIEMLWSPPPSHHLAEVLTVIANQRLLSPLLVIDCLANSSSCTLKDVRKYLTNILSIEEEITAKESAQGDRLKEETLKVKNDLHEASLKPLVCQTSRCAACSSPLELPTRHFLCNHSYHQHCIQSLSENEDECPACVPNNKKLIEVLRNQGTNPKITETFHGQLEKANDGFTIVAEYFGRGIFNKLTIITGDEMSAQAIDLSANDYNSNNILFKEAAVLKNENTNYPKTEARLRLEEGGNSKQIIASDAHTMLTTPKSSVLVPTPEGRMRLMEQKHQNPPYSSSGESFVTRSEPLLRNVNRYDSKINMSQDNNPKQIIKNNFSLKKSPINESTNNSSLKSINSQKESSSSKSTLNPFENDNTYDESKNPFNDSTDDGYGSKSSKNPFEDDENGLNGKNPFG